MAAPLDRDRRLVAQLGRDAARFGSASSAFAARRSIAREHLDVAPRSAAACAPTSRESASRIRCDLALLFDLQRAHAIVRLERRERLDEERLPARARVVHDARQARRRTRL